MSKNLFVVDGKEFNLDDAAQYMDDETRERVHSELAPCTAQKFWDRYSELNPSDAREVLNIIGEYR